MSLRTAHNRKNFKLEVSLDEKSHIWRSKPVLLEGLVEKESWITKACRGFIIPYILKF